MTRRSTRIQETPKIIKIHKLFGDRWFEGVVISSRPVTDEDDNDNDGDGDKVQGNWHLIRYEDGDREELDEEELEACKKNFENNAKGVHESEPPRKKPKMNLSGPAQKQANKNEIRSTRIQETPELIGVQKLFGDRWFEGVVISSRTATDEDGDGDKVHGTWHLIQYEDGDQEELDEEELEACKKNFENNAKGVHESEPARKKAKMNLSGPADKHANKNEIRSTRIQETPELIGIQKLFGDRWFEGVVISSRPATDEDGNKVHGTWYLIQYEDGDQEELDEEELQVCKKNFEDDAKGVYEREHPRKKKKMNRNSLRDKLAKVPPLPHTSANSSLWALLDPIDGQPVSREFIQLLAKSNPPAPGKLPDELWERIPEMLEFFVFMTLRQRVQQGFQVESHILKNYHWCNNYRELDRGTAYFRSELLKHLGDRIYRPIHRKQYTEQVLAMSYYYRTCNLIESFKNPLNPAGGIPRLGQFNADYIQYVQTFEDPSLKFFTSAHLNQGIKKYIHNSPEADIRDLAEKIASMKKFDARIICGTLSSHLKNVGPFIGWQMTCDLEEACCFGPKLKKVHVDKDKVQPMELNDDYCVLGPGAEDGLLTIFGPKIFHSLKSTDRVGLVTHLHENMVYLLTLVGLDFPLWRKRKVTFKVIEHALCEFQKFAKIDKGYTKGQRKWYSRAKWDERKVCCEGHDMIRCDTCHWIGCGACQMDKFQSIKPKYGFGSNCCHRCYALDQLILVD